MQDLKPCEEMNILAFDDSTTRPCGWVDMIVSLKEGEDKRSTNIYFLVVPCESVFKGFLGRPFVATLDVVASPVHLKMKYPNNGETSYHLCWPTQSAPYPWSDTQKILYYFNGHKKITKGSPCGGSRCLGRQGQFWRWIHFARPLLSDLHMLISDWPFLQWGYGHPQPFSPRTRPTQISRPWTL